MARIWQPEVSPDLFGDRIKGLSLDVGVTWGFYRKIVYRTFRQYAVPLRQMTTGRLAKAVAEVNNELGEKLVVVIHEPVLLTLVLVELDGASATVSLTVNDLHGKAPAHIVSAILEKFVPKARYQRPEFLIVKGTLIGRVNLIGFVTRSSRKQCPPANKDESPPGKVGANVEAEVLFLKYGT